MTYEGKCRIYNMRENDCILLERVKKLFGYVAVLAGVVREDLMKSNRVNDLDIC